MERELTALGQISQYSDSVGSSSHHSLSPDSKDIFLKGMGGRVCAVHQKSFCFACRKSQVEVLASPDKTEQAWGGVEDPFLRPWRELAIQVPSDHKSAVNVKME